MARERESTRSREETSSAPRTRSRGDNDARSNRTKKGGASRKIAINLDPKTYEAYGLWGDGEDVLVLSAWFAPWNYGGKTYDDGKQRVTLGLFVEYKDEATDEIHVEPVSNGDLRFFAPGTSPEADEDGLPLDYAGGDHSTWARIVNGEESISDEMRGPYMLPVPQGFDDEGKPIYKRLSGSRSTNGDFYIQQAEKCGIAAGVPIKYDKDDPSVDKLLAGIRGRLAKMSNTLRKGSGFKDDGGKESKPLVFEEIYERIDLNEQRGSRKRASREDADEKPAERTRSRRTSEAKEEPEEEPATDSPRRRGGRKPSEPTPEFLDDFKSKVEAFLDSQPKKACKRTRMTDLVEEYDADTPEERWALELVTDPKYIDTFWKASDDVFDYDEETDTAKL